MTQHSFGWTGKHALVACAMLLTIICWARPATGAVHVLADFYPEELATPNGEIIIHGYHAATADDPETYVCANGWLSDPNNSTLDFQWNCGYSAVAIWTTAYVHLGNFVAGRYEAHTTATDPATGSEGCARSDSNMTMFSDIYEFQSDEGNDVAIYRRCNPGVCQYAPVKRLAGMSPWPAFTHMNVITIDYRVTRGCYALTSFPVSSCAG